MTIIKSINNNDIIFNYQQNTKSNIVEQSKLFENIYCIKHRHDIYNWPEPLNVHCIERDCEVYFNGELYMIALHCRYHQISMETRWTIDFVKKPPDKALENLDSGNVGSGKIF